MTIKLDPHFYAVVVASRAISDIASILPDADLVEDLRNLSYIQESIFEHIIQCKHYGTNDLDDFIDYAVKIKKDVERLKESIEWYKE